MRDAPLFEEDIKINFSQKAGFAEDLTEKNNNTATMDCAGEGGCNPDQDAVNAAVVAAEKPAAKQHVASDPGHHGQYCHRNGVGDCSS